MKNKSQNIKKILILLTLIMFIVTINKITNTYALFYSQMTGTASKKLAKWNIDINQNNVNTVQEFVIQNINITENIHTGSNTIAPGMSGYFDILINPNDTQVSIKYDITIDKSNLETSSIQIDNIQEIEENKTIIQTGENTYTGIILLEEILTGQTNTIRINFDWENNETNNDADSRVGTIWDNKIEIPVTVCISQYLGEEIVSIN